ncbi:hypothetical protein WK76_24930 [Burkholderia ubonensis]|nr:hypothetical protein WK76_24930 [Burkholderia ubonensis]
MDDDSMMQQATGARTTTVRGIWHWMPVLLGSLATGTALCMSAIAGWERGAWLPERLLWVALGMVLTACAHFIPTMCRTATRSVGVAALLLWLGCTVAGSYGHATFFLIAQQHAGAARAAGVTMPANATVEPVAPLVKARLDVEAALVRLDARTCARNCDELHRRRTQLEAKATWLNAQIEDARRANAAVAETLAERTNAATQRALLRSDPVTARLAVTLGVPESRIDLAIGVILAAVLEGVACLCWLVASESCVAPARLRVASPAMASHDQHGAGASTADVSREQSHDCDCSVALLDKGLREGSHALAGDATLPVTEVVMDSVTPVATTEDESRRRNDGQMRLDAVAERAPSMTTSGQGPESDLVVTVMRGVATGRVRGTVAEIRRHLGCSQARAIQLRRQWIKEGVLA